MLPARMLGVLAMIAGASAWAGPRAPHGRVVRVERSRSFPLVTPVLCFQFQSDGSGLCIGPEPKTGDSVVLVDESQVVAEVRVDRASRAMPRCDLVWAIQGSVLRGDPNGGRHSKTMGLIDAGIDRRQARRIPEDKVERPGPDSRVEIGIDRDGDGLADVVVAQGACQTTPQCIEFWSRRSKGLERVWTANLQLCTP